jgi:hypothetical protein
MDWKSATLKVFYNTYKLLQKIRNAYKIFIGNLESMVTFGKLRLRREDTYLRKIHHLGSGHHLSG